MRKEKKKIFSLQTISKYGPDFFLSNLNYKFTIKKKRFYQPPASSCYNDENITALYKFLDGTRLVSPPWLSVDLFSLA